MFKPHIGTCISCGNDEVPIVVKAGLCKICNEKKKAEKKKNRKANSDFSGLKRSNKNAKKNMEFYIRMFNLWKSNGPIKCMECGSPIRNFGPSNVAHVLSRGSCPSDRIKYDTENAIPLCTYHHDQLDHGKNVKDMKIWEFVQKMREKLKRKYYNEL